MFRVKILVCAVPRSVVVPCALFGTRGRSICAPGLISLSSYFQGADFVEFDVQLTKNNVPVIYHDFTVCLTLKKVSTKFGFVGFAGFKGSHENDHFRQLQCLRCADRVASFILGQKFFAKIWPKNQTTSVSERPSPCRNGVCCHSADCFRRSPNSRILIFFRFQRDNTQHEYFEIPVQDLNLEQLQALKLNHPSEREQKPGDPAASSRVPV